MGARWRCGCNERIVTPPVMISEPGPRSDATNPPTSAPWRWFGAKMTS
jgi:hypothetical protein